MSDLRTAADSHSSLSDDLIVAKDTVTDLRTQVEHAFDELVATARTTGDEALRFLAEAIVYTKTEIATKIEDEEHGERALKLKVKELGKALRIAAKAGDARAAESDLADAENDLSEVKTDVRLLRKALRDHEANLFKAIDSVI